jgi:transcriptional regulator with XRE-family HTH domain
MVKLEKVRETRGLSQADVAILAGVSQAHICNVESGRRRLSPEARQRLIKGLGLSVDLARRVEELA